MVVKGRSFGFSSLREVMGKASGRRSGDELAGVGAGSQLERVAARMVLAEVPLGRFLEEQVVDPEVDEVSRLILESHDAGAFGRVKGMTVGELREWLLSYEVGAGEIGAVKWGLTPEMVAAVSKVCRNQDLILIAGKCEVVTRFRNTLGLRGRFSTRLQPNHPVDDVKGIAAAIVDGLLYGAGDACIGINPARDSVEGVCELVRMLREVVERYEIPTQGCVLSHVTTTMAAMERGAPVDLVFQSLAGTEGANRSFGVSVKLLDEARSAVNETGGRNRFYFETGQGSALSAGAHLGVGGPVDQQTLEARAYGVARRYEPLLVNTVVGFIGPEYLYDGKQILRAALEDHFCGKVLGLPMGVDVCYTNHAEADQDDMDVVLTCLGAAGVNFVMSVPGGDDVMLNYQSTSPHDAQYVRQVMGRRCAPEFEEWLGKVGVVREGRLLEVRAGNRLLGLGGDTGPRTGTEGTDGGGKGGRD